MLSGEGSRGLYGDYLKEATTVILKPPIITATRYYMCGTCTICFFSHNVSFYEMNESHEMRFLILNRMKI